MIIELEFNYLVMESKLRLGFDSSTVVPYTIPWLFLLFSVVGNILQRDNYSTRMNVNEISGMKIKTTLCMFHLRS